MTPILDLFIFYLRSVSLFFSTERNANISAFANLTVSIYQVPPGSITFGESVNFFCNVTGDNEDTGVDAVFEWDLHSSSSHVKPLLEGTSRQLEIIFNKTVESDLAESISCKVTLAGSLTQETIHPLTFLNNDNQSDTNFDCGNKADPTIPDPNLPSPSNITAAYIEGRSVVISWNPPVQEQDEELQVLEYVIEYKKTIQDWTNGIERVNIPLPANDLSAHVKNLKPWTTYHFRVVARYSTGQSAPSYPIVILTPEERPSGAPQDVKVRVKDKHTLQISWKPAPRSSWNGAILGYNIGSRKASTSSEESYTFHVLTARKLLGRPCVHEISVSDSTVPYKVVVQAFNNVGPGPLSPEATTEDKHPSQQEHSSNSR